MECAYYFEIPGGRHMECAYYFEIPGGRHMEVPTTLNFGGCVNLAAAKFVRRCFLLLAIPCRCRRETELSDRLLASTVY
jgi:hypothetical protein